jgi:hypothetical protein
MLDSYSNFWGEGVKDGFKIVGLKGRSLDGERERGKELVMD